MKEVLSLSTTKWLYISTPDVKPLGRRA